MLTSKNQLTEVELASAVRQLLAEGRAEAINRERSSFDMAFAASSGQVVLFGAGNLGRKTLAVARRLGIEPVAFADNNPRLWNTLVNGLTVLSPQAAAHQYGSRAIFLITIWRGEAVDRMAQRQQQLRTLGCQHVITFLPLFWRAADLVLPHYAVDLPHKVHDQADHVTDACGLWDDEASRYEYLAQVRWRLFGDFDKLPDPVRHTIYFPRDLCRLVDSEVFVDCGAYDGDSLESFLQQSCGTFRSIFSFEPDPQNFVRLAGRVAKLPQRDCIKLHQAAVGWHTGTVHFSASGDESSCVGVIGKSVVDCVALDEALASVEPTYIKMDIEGAELDAIAGASELIRSYSPVLAICSYHRQDHVWQIPLLIRSLNPNYRFFLRPHLAEVWDLVCYAIPEHRLVAKENWCP
jgi:FkbM family methyltransferase